MIRLLLTGLCLTLMFTVKGQNDNFNTHYNTTQDHFMSLYNAYNYVDALEVLNEMLALLAQKDNGLSAFDRDQQKAYCYSKLAGCYLQLGISHKAITYNLKALKCYQALKMYHRIIITLNNLSNASSTLNTNQVNINYLLQALNLIDSLTSVDHQLEKKSIFQIALQHNLAKSYQDLNQHDKAKALYLKNLDLIKTEKDSLGLFRTYSNLVEYYFDSDSGQFYIQQILSLIPELPDERYLAYLKAGDFYAHHNQFTLAESYYRKGLAVTRQYQLLDSEMTLLYYLGNLEKQMGQVDSAYQHLLEYIDINDSIVKLDMEQALLQSMNEQQTQEKEEKILLLNEKDKLQVLKIEQQQILLISAISITVLVLGLILTIWKNRNKLKNTYQQLKELDQSKQNLYRFIVHDLKTPLSLILNEAQQPRIQQAANQLLQLTLSILDIQKMESQHLSIKQVHVSSINLIQVATQQVSFLSKEKNVNILLEIEQDFMIHVDQELIIRVWVNLLTNAIKFSPLNQSITVRTQHNETTKSVRFMVLDQGKGISMAKQTQIFDLYQQAEIRNAGKVRASGLGLSFVKMTIEVHNGAVGVISTENKGACFWFELPYTETTQVTLTPDPPTSTPLTQAELTLLSPFKLQLQNIPYFNYLEVQKILQAISNDADAITSWKEEVRNSCLNSNEVRYLELITTN